MKELPELVNAYVQDTETDLFVFNAGVESGRGDRPVDQFVTKILEKKSGRSRVAVFFVTYGGDPDGAYRLIRCLRSTYTHVRLLICGPCKSAGTLVATGAHALAFSPTGELGPLDIQVVKPDEAGRYGSGLDIFNSLTILTSLGVEKFQDYAETVLSGPLGNISTKTATDLAVRLATGILTPIAAQIDPLRLGETDRAMKILREYGTRVSKESLKPGALDRLIEGYPAHGFVIDMEEAKELFNTVEQLSDDEMAIADSLGDLVRYASSRPLVLDLQVALTALTPKATTDDDNKETGSDAADSAEDVPGTEGNSPKTEGVAA